MSMSCAAIKRFGIGDGARRLALDPATGQPVANADQDGATFDWSQAGAEIDRQARALVATTGCGYSEAVHRVLCHPDNEDLAATYAHRVGPGEKLVARQYAEFVDNPQARAAASQKLHTLTIARMQRNPELTYQQAAEAVCSDPATAALRRSWTGQTE
jgi:hypothetical protein